MALTACPGWEALQQLLIEFLSVGRDNAGFMVEGLGLVEGLVLSSAQRFVRFVLVVFNKDAHGLLEDRVRCG